MVVNYEWQQELGTNESPDISIRSNKARYTEKLRESAKFGYVQH